MRIAVVNTQQAFLQGGAESLANGLVSTLTSAGHEVDLIRIPFLDHPQALFDNLLVSRLLDFETSSIGNVDLLIGLKFPAYLARHSNKIIWVIHQHRAIYDLWDNRTGGYAIREDGAVARAAVQAADKVAFSEARAIYAISKTVARRLATYNGVSAQPIFTPPENAELFYAGAAEDFFYLPSRITHTKRQDLIIRSLALTRNPIRLILAGPNSDRGYFEKLMTLIAELRLENKVRVVGHVSPEQHRDLFSRCIGVLFCPQDEDYGYVTLEGMLSSKPVITTHDAGEPAEFVQHRETGLVVEPTAEALAAALDELWEDKTKAAVLGRSGRSLYSDCGISWTNAIKALLA